MNKSIAPSKLRLSTILVLVDRFLYFSISVSIDYRDYVYGIGNGSEIS